MRVEGWGRERVEGRLNERERGKRDEEKNCNTFGMIRVIESSEGKESRVRSILSSFSPTQARPQAIKSLFPHHTPPTLRPPPPPKCTYRDAFLKAPLYQPVVHAVVCVCVYVE